MRVFIEINCGSKPIGDIYYWGKISGNFLPVLNWWKIFNPCCVRVNVWLMCYCVSDAGQLMELLSAGETDDVIKQLVLWLGQASSYLVENQPVFGNVDTVLRLYDEHQVYVYFISVVHFCLMFHGWRFGLAVTRWSRSTSYSMPGPVNTGMGDCLRTGTSSRYVTSHLGRLSLPSLRGR